MRAERNEFKVGVTVVVVFVLFVAVLAFIGQWGAIFARTKELHVRFKHQDGIQGLRIKDPVRVGGLNVGRVRNIRLQADPVGPSGEKRELYVYVSCDIPYFVELFEDCKISIGTKFVGEGGTLDILDTGRKGKKLGEKEVIDGLPPAGFAALTSKLSKEFDETVPTSVLSQIKQQLNYDNPASLVAKIHKSVDDINVISAGIRAQMSLDEQTALMAKIHKVADNMTELTKTLRNQLDRSDKEAALAKVHLALNNLNGSLERVGKMLEEGEPKVQTSLNHVQATAKRVDEKISVALARELDRASADSLLSKIHASISSAQAGMENLKSLTATGKELLVINRENLQGVIDNVVETAAHLKGTAKDLRRNPWRLMYKPDKPEREYANLMAAARNFNDAASYLDQVNSKLTQILKLHPQGVASDDPQLAKIREQIKQAFCEFEQAQNKLWDLLKLRS